MTSDGGASIRRSDDGSTGFEHCCFASSFVAERRNRHLDKGAQARRHPAIGPADERQRPRFGRMIRQDRDQTPRRQIMGQRHAGLQDDAIARDRSLPQGSGVIDAQTRRWQRHDMLAIGPEQCPAIVRTELREGVTAQYLVEDSGRLAAGDRVLVQAASGGVGRLLTQMATALGTEVHALASTPPKRQQARSNGANAVYGHDDWVAQVRQATGDGVDLVYDSIGTMLHDSLAALRPGGRVVIFGKAGGMPPAIDPLVPMEQSKGVVGGGLWTYLNGAESRQSRADRLFAALRAGA
jgi:hypothetical protein